MNPDLLHVRFGGVVAELSRDGISLRAVDALSYETICLVAAGRAGDARGWPFLGRALKKQL